MRVIRLKTKKKRVLTHACVRLIASEKIDWRDFVLTPKLWRITGAGLLCKNQRTYCVSIRTYSLCVLVFKGSGGTNFTLLCDKQDRVVRLESELTLRPKLPTVSFWIGHTTTH